jgi:hypothetical protein
MSKRVVASAEVVVTLKIAADGLWGPECSLDQIHRQAKDSVNEKLFRMAQAVKGTDIKIVKWDDIKTVSTEEDR